MCLPKETTIIDALSSITNLSENRIIKRYKFINSYKYKNNVRAALLTNLWYWLEKSILWLKRYLLFASGIFTEAERFQNPWFCLKFNRKSYRFSQQKYHYLFEQQYFLSYVKMLIFTEIIYLTPSVTYQKKTNTLSRIHARNLNLLTSDVSHIET